MSGHPDASGGAVDLAQAGPAGTVAVALLLTHIPAREVGVPVELWPGGRVANHREEVLGIDVSGDQGYRVRPVAPGQVEVTRWRRGVQLSCVLATERAQG